MFKKLKSLFRKPQRVNNSNPEVKPRIELTRLHAQMGGSHTLHQRINSKASLVKTLANNNWSVPALLLYPFTDIRNYGAMFRLTINRK